MRMVSVELMNMNRLHVQFSRQNMQINYCTLQVNHGMEYGVFAIAVPSRDMSPFLLLIHGCNCNAMAVASTLPVISALCGFNLRKSHALQALTSSWEESNRGNRNDPCDRLGQYCPLVRFWVETYCFCEMLPLNYAPGLWSRTITHSLDKVGLYFVQ